jgi:two-component system, OmpR family, sensor histidine kinase TctE
MTTEPPGHHRRPSLRLRLFLGILLPLVVLSVVVSGLRYRSAQEMSQNLYDNTLKVVAHAIARDVVLTKGDVLADALLESLMGAMGDPIYYQVYAPEGGFLTGYSDAPIDVALVDLPGGRPVFANAWYQGRPVRVVLLREFISDPEFSGWTTVQVWQTVTQRQALSLQLLAQAAQMLVLVVGAAALLVWFGINWGLRPLTDLRAAVLRRSPDELGPIRRPVPSEAAPLVAAMNALFTRLRKAFDRRDAFIANAAHQLRNPIASIQAQAEAACGARSEADLRARVRDLHEVARRTSRLTRQLLSLDTAAQRPFAPDGAALDLAEIAAEAARRHVPRALDRDVELNFEIADGAESPDLTVAGDAVLLEEAVDNLVDNALRYGCPEGGAISLRVAARDGEVSLSVSDCGPGIGQRDAQRVFERFTRLDEDGGRGCGLGLSIVRTIATRHGGRIDLDRSPSGGACFTLSLPQARPEAAAAAE